VEQDDDHGDGPADLLTLVDDEASSLAKDGPRADRIKIAVVDDDAFVHEGTRFALANYALGGRSLEILSAYSAAEAKVLLRRHPDIAVVLLDVVMETDRAGLDLVGTIREELGNETVRIILRTGQPGQAPERDVVLRYDINDYKAKTELTADKLFTALTAALRSHDQLMRISDAGRKLEAMLGFTGALFGQRSLHRLAEEVLDGVATLTGAGGDGLVVIAAPGGEERVLAGRGAYAGAPRALVRAELGEPLSGLISTALEGPGVVSRRPFAVGLRTEGGRRIAVVATVPENGGSLDDMLLKLFCDRVAAAFDTLLLQDDLRQANERLEQRVTQRTAELMAANRRLETQWARARSTAAFQNELLGIVAHDLKNPLAVIMGRTEILQELVAQAPLLAENARNQIDRIRESARRLTGMVDGLIKDAMGDTLELPIRREETDLVALVREAIEANKPLADRKGQTIAFSAPPGIAVPCDHERMREAVDNLVSNAVKYSRPGGAIGVDVAVSGSEVVITVTDSGPGLLPEDFPRLFGRFQRLSARPTGGENSTGLGLFIAKRIVDLHGGRLEVVSPVQGGGSAFIIAIGLPAGREVAA
jgi:signal transduction histidine kinase